VKNALVTGAAGGLGRVIADQLADEGWAVGLLDLSADAIRKAGPLKPNCVAISCDVGNPASVEAALNEFGKAPDLLVNNAGIVRFGPLIDIAQEDFDLVVRVNLVGAFTMARACAKRIVAAKSRGVIINITSMNGIVPGPNSGAYTSTKSGLALLTKQMAVEWGPLGIRVNAIAPGLIPTEGAGVYGDPEVKAARAAAVPIGRLGTPLDIANAVAFFASEQSSYVNGQALFVDGGLTQSLMTFLPRPKGVAGPQLKK